MSKSDFKTERERNEVGDQLNPEQARMSWREGGRICFTKFLLELGTVFISVHPSRSNGWLLRASFRGLASAVNPTIAGCLLSLERKVKEEGKRTWGMEEGNEEKRDKREDYRTLARVKNPRRGGNSH